MKKKNLKQNIFFIALLFGVFFGFEKCSLAYDPPIGIPMPWVAPDIAAPSAPDPWISEQAGHYYVNFGEAGCSDSRPYGYPNYARCTVPSSVSAGSRVEIHGGTTYITPAVWNLNGAEGSPVWVVGVNTPIFSGSNTEHNIRGQWFFVDGLKWINSKLRFGQSNISAAHHVVLRNSEITGWVEEYSHTSMLGFNNHPTEDNHDNVIYNVNIHDNGEYTYSGDIDIDHHGISPGVRQYNLWVLDSIMSRNAGDGIQINATSAAGGDLLHHIYVGRSVFDNNLQNGTWVKQARDVIFSENVAYNHRAKTYSPGAGYGQQYGPERVWYINNVSYNNDVGIRVASDSDMHGTNVYFIGNLIYNIANTAIETWDADNRYFVNNTISGANRGLDTSAGATTIAVVENNIIADMAISPDIYFASVTDMANSSMRNNIVTGDSIAWGHSPETLAQFTARTGMGGGSITASPTFTNSGVGDFSLTTGSVGIDGGRAADVYASFLGLYGIDIAKDKNGVIRPQGAAWDIGAFEYISGGDATPPGAPSGLAVL